MIIAAFLLAYLTYRFIEMPIRREKQRDWRRKGALWLLGSVSIIGVFGVLVVLMKGFPARLPSAIIALDHDFAHDASDSWREGTCFLRPDQSDASFSNSCVDSEKNRAGQPLVRVWGDSHAADLLPGFRALQNQAGVRLAQFTASLCAPLIGLPVRERPACLSINDAVLGRIRKLKPDTVVLSAYWDYWNQDRAVQAEKLRQTIEFVKAAGVRKVVVLGSVPIWTEPVPGLLISELRRRPNTALPHSLPRSLLETHNDTLLKAATLGAGAVYVPVFERLCDETSCVVTTGPGWRDIVTYDHTHFTDHGSILVVQDIWKWIRDS
jgi:hypothetical protein